MPTANRHTRIATRIICGRFVFINVAPHRALRLRELARWPRKSCFLTLFVQRHRFANLPSFLIFDAQFAERTSFSADHSFQPPW